MARGLWQSTYCRNQIFASDPTRFRNCLACDQLGQCRSAGDSRNATFRFKSDALNPSIMELEAQPDYVSANRVLDFSARVCIRNITSVAGILKMIEQLHGIHRQIVNAIQR
jgi:hypothetical protein